ncbi:MAG: tRNA pseudouridine(55) synthase TruB [Erysipelotrichaceae bacterium]|nr:tRNA pseudouridine(55) synthase TruB [Erysipelotrichaceae bacterium]
MNGIILINKEKGYTSHDVVNIARKVLHTKKVGHGGTLDPDATGLLVLCVNKATKALQFISNDAKVYQAKLTLGLASDTFDISGEILERQEVRQYSREEIVQALESFLGQSEQVPPIYSALKVKGKKLYEYARNNEAVEIEPRQITITAIELIGYQDNVIEFKVACSKGTYIRSLCVDIAAKLGTIGLMSDLVRLQAGSFSLEDAVTIEQFKNNEYEILPIESALKGYPAITVDEKIVIHGKPIESNLQGDVAVYNDQGKILAIYRSDSQGYLRSVRGLF